MKPQNKLNGKLDKLKEKFAFESSKKVKEINRSKVKAQIGAGDFVPAKEHRTQPTNKKQPAVKGVSTDPKDKRIKELKAELEAIKKDYTEISKALDTALVSNTNLEAHISRILKDDSKDKELNKLRQELVLTKADKIELIDALRFYAERKHIVKGLLGNKVSDDGEKARYCLSKFE